jgi:ORF6N domain-containing protein
MSPEEPAKHSLMTARLDQRIHELRGHNVMLDRDLADLYGVEVRVLNQAVMRNSGRFPSDFMFQLTVEEADRFRSETASVQPRHGGRRHLPFAFTEEGVAMLSSVLRSDRAVRVNVEIMRAFVRMRRMVTDHKDLSRRLDALEAKYDDQFKVVFEAIRQLMAPPPAPAKVIGFRTDAEE